MKLTLYSFITRSSVSIFSYSISAWSVTALFFCIVIILAGHTQAILSRQSHQMERFCSCGVQVHQQQFCEHDFVFAGKRVNRLVKTFNQGNGIQISELAGYKGEIYRIRLKFNFKGIFINYSREKLFVNLYVIRGLNCGVDRDVELSLDKTYVISGYKYKSMLLVSSCNWIQSFDSLTGVQTAGLFSNLYQNYCYIKDKCQINFLYKPSKTSNQNCDIRTTFKECYEQFAICQLQSNNQCGILTNLTSMPVKVSMRRLPKKLRQTYRRDKNLQLNRFDFCVNSKINNNNVWRL